MERENVLEYYDDDLNRCRAASAIRLTEFKFFRIARIHLICIQLNGSPTSLNFAIIQVLEVNISVPLQFGLKLCTHSIVAQN